MEVQTVAPVADRFTPSTQEGKRGVEKPLLQMPERRKISDKLRNSASVAWLATGEYVESQTSGDDARKATAIDVYKLAMLDLTPQISARGPFTNVVSELRGLNDNNFTQAMLFAESVADRIVDQTEGVLSEHVLDLTAADAHQAAEIVRAYQEGRIDDARAEQAKIAGSSRLDRARLQVPGYGGIEYLRLLIDKANSKRPKDQRIDTNAYLKNFQDPDSMVDVYSRIVEAWQENHSGESFEPSTTPVEVTTPKPPTDDVLKADAEWTYRGNDGEENKQRFSRYFEAKQAYDAAPDNPVAKKAYVSAMAEMYGILSRGTNNHLETHFVDVPEIYSAYTQFHQHLGSKEILAKVSEAPKDKQTDVRNTLIAEDGDLFDSMTNLTSLYVDKLAQFDPRFAALRPRAPQPEPSTETAAPEATPVVPLTPIEQTTRDEITRRIGRADNGATFANDNVEKDGEIYKVGFEGGSESNEDLTPIIRSKTIDGVDLTKYKAHVSGDNNAILLDPVVDGEDFDLNFENVDSITIAPDGMSFQGHPNPNAVPGEVPEGFAQDMATYMDETLRHAIPTGYEFQGYEITDGRLLLKLKAPRQASTSVSAEPAQIGVENQPATVVPQVPETPISPEEKRMRVIADGQKVSYDGITKGLEDGSLTTETAVTGAIKRVESDLATHIPKKYEAVMEIIQAHFEDKNLENVQAQELEKLIKDKLSFGERFTSFNSVLKAVREYIKIRQFIADNARDRNTTLPAPEPAT